MDIEQKKEAIKKCLRIAKYSKPENITFTDENDHNPLVLETCKICFGSKYICLEDNLVAVKDLCDACDGLGVTGNLVRRYSEDYPAMSAIISETGWIKCPNCKVNFSTDSSQFWSGRRHITCGQKIDIVTSK
jgi:hypothetical protein